MAFECKFVNLITNFGYWLSTFLYSTECNNGDCVHLKNNFIYEIMTVFQTFKIIFMLNLAVQVSVDLFSKFSIKYLLIFVS